MKLGFLQDVYDHPGPFATVYLNTSADWEDATKATQLRWRSAREHLVSQGLDEATVKALGKAVDQHQWRSGQRGQVLVAANGELVFSDELPRPPEEYSDDEQAYVGPLPMLLPYLRLRATRIPYVVGMVDREGADITTVTNDLDVVRSSVEGDGYPIHKAAAARTTKAIRIERTVEEEWMRNAAQVAAALNKQAAETAAEVIVLTGEVGQRSAVLKYLWKNLRDRVVEVDVGHRDRNSDPESLRKEIDDAVHAQHRASIEQAAAEFKRERGQRARAVAGWPHTIAALQQGLIKTLIWAVPEKDIPSLPLGPEPTQLALDAATLSMVGVDSPQYAPASAVILRALVNTQAEIVLLEPTPTRDVPESVGEIGEGNSPTPLQDLGLDLESGVGAILRTAAASEVMAAG